MEKLQRIFLIGFMGCGKSTHGKKLAKLVSYPFIDLDHYIEKKENTTIDKLFADKGEDNFRELETMYLKQVISRYEKAVISTGGGTACFHGNIELMKKSGTVAYIQMSAEALHHRLSNANADRPLLKGKTAEEALQTIQELLKKRESFYEQAHVTVNGINLTSDKLKEALSLFIANS